MNFEIMPLTKERYDEWNRFCLESDSAWFRHTTWFLEYVQNCRFDKKSKNLSFGIYCDNNLSAIAPLIMQTIYAEPELFEFAIGDTNTPFPAFDNSLHPNNKKDIVKIIFQEIDRLAKENNVVYAKFFIDPLTEEILDNRQRINHLPRFGYHDTSLSTNIISLSLPEEELFGNIRKGHKADIKTATKNGFVVDILSQENISAQCFQIYKNLHLLAAGRKTRPDESWDNMFEFINKGYSILALAKEPNNNQYVAGTFIITYKGKAYYGSGAIHPEFEKIRGVGHLLHWEAIKYLKKRRCNYYETGWNYYPAISQEVASEKELNISLFKAGFGGEAFPLFRGEKFYSREYLAKTYSKRIKKFIAIL